jgi:hypothetical protein
MKYLKTFESITNSIFNIAPFQKYFGLTPDEFEDYFVGMVDDLDLNAKVMWDRGINAATVKIQVPVEGNSDLHGWFNENLKPKLSRIKTQLKNNYGLEYSGYQTGLTYTDGDQSFYYKLIWYKSKTNESFEVVLPKSTNEIINNYGLTMEDIEDLFLEFSDMGYNIRMMPSLGLNIGKDTLIVDVTGELESSSKTSIDPFPPEISSLVRRVIRNSTGLGLYLVESPNRMNNMRQGGKWTGTIRFTFKKR